MERAHLFNDIEARLSWLVSRIEVRGSLNILNLNLHSEDFYLHLLNLIFGWKLINLNIVTSNAAGLDLIDNQNRIVLQVSSTATRQKVQSALMKNLADFEGWQFKFISICKDASKLRDSTKPYVNPHRLIFKPVEDVFDIPKLLKIINSKEIEEIKKVQNFCKIEIQPLSEPEVVESNLTKIIKILATEDWTPKYSRLEKIPYDVENKISYNQLKLARTSINQYKFHYPRIRKIYGTFDDLGKNKSLSVLDGIQSIYIELKLSNDKLSPDQVFFLVVKNVGQRLEAYRGYLPLPQEEIDLCVQILVVDAFIRCKIFENPMEAENANS